MINILLSSNNTTFKVTTRKFSAKARENQVSAELHTKVGRELGAKVRKEQSEYLSIAAQAAFASLNKLDWLHYFHGEVNLESSSNSLASLTLESNSAGLGYALALALEWRKQLKKPNDYTAEVFATGRIHSSGAVTNIGHLKTKIAAACNFMEKKNKVTQTTETPVTSPKVKVPFVIFYPISNQDDVTPELKKRVEDLNGELCPVERLQSALTILLDNSYDGEPAGRWQPFKGLESFDYEDSLRFFGRGDARKKLLKDYDETDGLFVVEGKSGSGKSSLVKAGLIPDIQKSLKDEKLLYWKISNLTKSEGDLNRLLNDLYELLQAHWHYSSSQRLNMTDALSQPDSLIASLQEAQQTNENTHLLWYIDQYEEIFNSSNIDPDQGKQFSVLLDKLTRATPNLIFIISIRSEYDDNLIKSSPESHVSSALKAEEWLDIIENQAMSFGLDYEEGLVEEIHNETLGIANALPAVEFLLTQMYEELIEEDEKAKRLTFRHYEALGGIAGVIKTKADKAIINHFEQTNAFFEHFVGITNDKEPKPRAKFVALKEIERDTPALYELIQEFIKSQLIVDCSTTHEKKVKLAHDTLLDMGSEISHWGMLKTWFEKHKDYMVWYKGNEANFINWTNFDEKQKIALDGISLIKEDFLLSKVALHQAQELQQQGVVNNQSMVKYINESQQYFQRLLEEEALKQKKEKQKAWATVVLATALLLILGFMYRELKISESTTLKAKEELIFSNNNLLLGHIPSLNKEKNYVTSILLGLNVFSTNYGGNGKEVSLSLDFFKSIFSTHKIIDFDETQHKFIHLMNKTGQKYIKYNYHSQSISLFDIDSGVLISILEHKNSLYTVKFSDDDKLLVCIDDKGIIYIWDTDTGSKLQEFNSNINPNFSKPNVIILPNYEARTKFIKLSPDNKHVLLNDPSIEGVIYKLFRIKDGKLLFTKIKKKNSQPAQVNWHPKSNTIYTVFYHKQKSFPYKYSIEYDYVNTKGSRRFSDVGDVVDHKNILFSPSGRYFILHNDIWDSVRNKLTLEFEKGAIPLLFYSDDQIFVQEKGVIKSYNMEGEVLTSWKNRSVSQLFYEPVDKVFIGYDRNRISIFDLELGAIREIALSIPNKGGFLDAVYNDRKIFLTKPSGVYKLALTSNHVPMSVYHFKGTGRTFFYRDDNTSKVAKPEFLSYKFSSRVAPNENNKNIYDKISLDKINFQTIDIKTPYGFVNKAGTVMAVRDKNKNIDVYEINSDRKPYELIGNNVARGGQYLLDEKDIKQLTLILRIESGYGDHKFNESGSLLYNLRINRLAVYDIKNEKLKGNIYPESDFRFSNFHVTNSKLITLEKQKEQLKLKVWDEDLKLIRTFELIDNIDKMVVWKISKSQNELIIVTENNTIDVFSLKTGNIINTIKINSEVENIFPLTSDSFIVTTILGEVLLGSTLEQEVKSVAAVDKNFSIELVGSKHLLIGKGKNYKLIPLLKQRDLIEHAINKLPINKKCLSDLERDRYFLPKRSNKQKEVLGCL